MDVGRRHSWVRVRRSWLVEGAVEDGSGEGPCNGDVVGYIQGDSTSGVDALGVGIRLG